MKEIVQKGDPALRKKAVEVPRKDITSDTIASLLKDMFEVLEEKKYGVALAAPQIGTSLRIFVLADKFFDEEERSQHNLVYINPTIIKTSKKNVDLEEACLSIEDYFGVVTRAERATIEAYDEHGSKFTRGASGLLAQIFQHEIDHLNGILYTDHARDIQKVEKSPEKTTENKNE